MTDTIFAVLEVRFCGIRIKLYLFYLDVWHESITKGILLLSFLLRKQQQPDQVVVWCDVTKKAEVEKYPAQ